MIKWRDTNKKLSQQEYFELDEQFARTPGISDGWMASGEHYVLQAMLDDLGYHPSSREEALEIAGRLLSDGYDQD